MTEALNAATAKLVAALQTAGITPKVIENSTFVMVPDAYKFENVTEAVEKALPAPNRRKGTFTLASVDSLLAYCEDQNAPASAYIYADPETRTITAVFNDQRTGAGWRDHRATYKAELTPEAKRWLEKDGTQFTQTDFAEWVEDNFADLQGEEAQNLLTVATTIQATSGINFSSARRLQDGQTQLVYNESIEATAGANGEFKIPKTFKLGLRLFKNGGGYELLARLKYRLHSGTVKFWYELDRPERAIEDAFGGYVATVAEKSGYRVLLGKA